MGRTRIFLSTLALLAITGPFAATSDDEPAAREFAATVVVDVGGQLKQALSKTMSTRGPVAAVEVCNSQAPKIAQAVGEKHDVTVRRVTTRPRNPANAADPWEMQQLALFAEALKKGVTPDEISALDARAGDGSVAYRFMRPILVQPLCLTCHGETLTDNLAEVIDRLYPHDKARGYTTGDLRGAFVVEWVENAKERVD